jgi:AcrR family transcriptional regulator
VGRPRHLDDEAERRVLIDAGYAALRDEGQQFTIAAILSAAGVSTRSFYRQFVSKDALLCAMYRRDANWAAARIEQRLSTASTPTEAVECWVDEILGFRSHPRRAERVTVLGSLRGTTAEGMEIEVNAARAALVAPLRAAIEQGVADGSFTTDDPERDANLVAAAVTHAAGLSAPLPASVLRLSRRYRQGVVAFCLRALGAHPRG